MSLRSKSKRNRRSIVATLKNHNTIPFKRENMVPGIVYHHAENGWLFTLRPNGTLATDCGYSFSDLKTSKTDHSHWFDGYYRKLTRTNRTI